jgi:hypothetical protein
MSRRRGSWDRLRLRDRQRRYGAENITGSTPPQQFLLDLPLQHRRHTPSKAELRSLGESALAQWRSRQR